jgi:hypothetical protein
MALMNTVCVVKAENTPVIGAQPMGQKKGKIVAIHQIPFVNPDLLADDTDATCTPKFSLVISLLARASLSSHQRILVQVMRLKQQLQLSWLSLSKKKGPLVSGPC